jgi:hypothetical protein
LSEGTKASYFINSITFFVIIGMIITAVGALIGISFAKYWGATHN